jgi:hypothetical protein
MVNLSLNQVQLCKCVVDDLSQVNKQIANFWHSVRTSYFHWFMQETNSLLLKAYNICSEQEPSECNFED